MNKPTIIEVIKKAIEIKMIAIEAFAYGECMGVELNQWYCKIYSECQKLIETIKSNPLDVPAIVEATKALIEIESNPPLHGGTTDELLKKCLEDLEDS